MQTITLEPLRWSEQPARVTILNGNGHPKAYFQITSPRDIARMAIGRPVEETPRLVGILSPAHHLVSAMALDKLFDVQPPDLAVNMREALLQAQFVRHHLRKLYFLLSSEANPFRSFQMRQAAEEGSEIPVQALDEIMDCLALAQEAAAILGGRADHPISAVSGGVGRFLKDPHYPRLAEIAEQCVKCAVGAAKFVREKVFLGSKKLVALRELQFNPMLSLTAGAGTGNAILRDTSGKQVEEIPADKVF